MLYNFFSYDENFQELLFQQLSNIQYSIITHSHHAVSYHPQNDPSFKSEDMELQEMNNLSKLMYIING